MFRWIPVVALLFGAQQHQDHSSSETGLVRNGPPVVERSGPLRRALLLLREGDTAEARKELERLRKSNPDDPEVHYQIARSYLADFHSGTDPAKKRVSLSLALEALSAVLKQNPDHINALKAKSVIHARAELLHYNPNLAYELAQRVVKLQPHAHEYVLNLSEWLSGEVRLTGHDEHRVPHDPQLGIDRSIDLIERVLDDSMPFSPEEGAAAFQLAKSLSRRGNFAESIAPFKQALKRATTPEQKLEVLREMGASYYRLGDFQEAAARFYAALQERNNLVDQWLLKTAIDQLPPGAAPKLPVNLAFPSATPPSAVAGIQFENIAAKLGVDRLDGNGTCAWADIDGDGRLDLALSGSGTFMALYRNRGSKFEEVTESAGLANVPSGYSLNFVDYDNDGRQDLYISYNGWNGPMKNRLFRNVGAGRFEDVSESSGAADEGSGFVSVWGDLDNDGYLDLVVANGVLKDGSTPQIYRNNGNGTFTNMTRRAGIDEPPTFGAIGAALGDYDRDGDLDILINGLNDAPNRLYRNDGKWKFSEVSQKSGLAQPPHNGFVCFFFDYNNDGWPDVLTTSLAPWPAVLEGLRDGYKPASRAAMHPDTNRLFRNNGDGTFRDVTWEAKLYYPMGAMGAGVADLDNDGFVDLYIGTGDPQLSRLEPNRFFRNNGDGTFTDLTAITGFERPGNKGHGVSFVDIDDDGDLDIYAQLGGHYQGDHARNAFYRNLQGNRNHWLEVELTGVKSNRFAVGAKIVAKTGSSIVYREVKGSEGFGATNPYRQHLGLGKHARVDSLEVEWPSGARQVFRDVDANQILAIREDSKDLQRIK